MEALLFLKVNFHLWSIKDVREALHRVKANKKADRTSKKMTAHQEDEEMAADGVVRMGEEAEEVGPVNYGGGSWGTGIGGLTLRTINWIANILQCDPSNIGSNILFNCSKYCTSSDLL